MNKLLLIGLSAALALSGCRRSELGTDGSDENTIRFSTETASKSTKVDSDNGLSDMGVFCSATGLDAWDALTHTPNKMFNTKLKNTHYGVPEATSSAWDYAQTSDRTYWGGGMGTYFTFFAYAPYASTDNGITVEPMAVGIPQIKYAAPMDVTKRPDLMVAEQRVNIHPVSAVGLKMHHALSAITFSAKKPDGETQTIKVNSVTFHNAQYEGTLPLYYGPSGLAWDVDYDEAKERSIGVTTDNVLKKDVALTTSMQSITQAGKALFMLPQLMDAKDKNPALTPISLLVSFDVDGVDQEVSFDLTGLSDWEAGKAYDYQITYVPGTRTFDLVVSVTDWAEQLMNGDVEGTYLKAAERNITMSVEEEGNLFYSSDYTGVGLAKVSGPPSGTLTITKVAGESRFKLNASQTGDYTVRLTAGKLWADVSVKVTEAPSYVKIGNLYWATGNLVATTGGGVASGTNGSNVRIGRRTDGGLYFQFGSLIGYKGGALANNGSGVGKNPYSAATTTFWNGAGTFSWGNDAMVWPTEMTTNPTAWPADVSTAAGDRTTLIDKWYFSYNVAPYSSDNQDIRGFSTSFAGDKGSGTLATGRYAKWGIGDPCTYYLGGSWRLPTGAEYGALCNNKSGSWVDAGGSWVTVPTIGATFASDKLFFPASGLRNHATGEFKTVDSRGYGRTSTINDNAKAPALYFRNPDDQANVIFPQSPEGRTVGMPVRCVADEVAVDQNVVVIPPSGGSVTVNVFTFDGMPWRVTTIRGEGIVVSPTSGTGSGPITFTYGPSPTVRPARVRITSGSTTIDIKAVQGDVVVDGDLAWAKGNLVARGAWNDYKAGCKVGAPTDGGLYYQFGSLIGHKGGSNTTYGDGIGGLPPLSYNGYAWFTQANWGGINDVSRNPVTNPGSWPQLTTGTNQWFFSNQNVISGNLNVLDPANAVGDPCAYFLGAPWRLPNSNDFTRLFDGQASWASSPNWQWQTSPAGALSTVKGGLFLPAAGYRHPANGTFLCIGSEGFYQTSVISGATTTVTAYIRNSGYEFSFPLRTVGSTVRCVVDML